MLGENVERILRQLAILPHGDTGNRLHQLSGASSQLTTQRKLDKLVHIGIVVATAIGNSKRYELNRSHALWPVVELGLETSARTEDKIGDLVRNAVGTDAVAAVYGSFARGEAGPNSDVDILIVWPNGTDTDVQDEAISAIDLGVKQNPLPELASRTFSRMPSDDSKIDAHD